MSAAAPSPEILEQARRDPEGMRRAALAQMKVLATSARRTWEMAQAVYQLTGKPEHRKIAEQAERALTEADATVAALLEAAPAV